MCVCASWAAEVRQCVVFIRVCVIRQSRCMIPQWLVYARDHEISCVRVYVRDVHRHVCAGEHVSFVLVKDLGVRMKDVVCCMLGRAPRTPPVLLCRFHQATAVLV